MPDITSPESDQLRKSRRSDPTTNEFTNQQQGAPFQSSDLYRPSLVANRHPGTRGGEPIRTSTMQRMQQTHGNRAVQRFVGSPRRSPVPVQRELEGVLDVLKTVGGTGAPKGDNWGKVLGNMEKYDTYETKLLEKREKLENLQERNTEGVWGWNNRRKLKNTQKDITKRQAKMQDLLNKTEASSQDWKRANADTSNLNKAQKTEVNERKRLINSLGPRLTMAKRNLGNPTKARSDKDLDANQTINKFAGGQVNSLDKVVYQDSTEALYKRELHDLSAQPFQEERIGIEKRNPMYGARSVASSELDKLLGTNLLAKTEFATHKTVDTAVGQKDKDAVERPTMGINMEIAKGKELRKLMKDPEKSSFVREEGSTKLGLNDPELQRGLNRLQLLDALSGQVDRHMGNIFVNQNEQTGRVTGVTGIDNDMAFGKNQKNADILNPDPLLGGSFKGLPPVVDEDMYHRLRRPSLSGHVRDTLTGLLPQADVNSTLERLGNIQEQLGQYRPEQIIGPEGWGNETVLGQTPKNSYLGAARLEKFSNEEEQGGQIEGAVGQLGKQYQFDGGQQFLDTPVTKKAMEAIVTHSVTPRINDARALATAGMHHLDQTTPIPTEADRKKGKGRYAEMPMFERWAMQNAQQFMGGEQAMQPQQPTTLGTNQGQDRLKGRIDPMLVRRRIGMMLQSPNPFPTKSIPENVADTTSTTSTQQWIPQNGQQLVGEGQAQQQNAQQLMMEMKEENPELVGAGQNAQGGRAQQWANFEAML